MSEDITWHMANGSSVVFKGDPNKDDELICMDEPPTFTGCCNCGQSVEVKGFNVEWNCIRCGEKCGIYTGWY